MGCESEPVVFPGQEVCLKVAYTGIYEILMSNLENLRVPYFRQTQALLSGLGCMSGFLVIHTSFDAATM